VRPRAAAIAIVAVLVAVAAGWLLWPEAPPPAAPRMEDEAEDPDDVDVLGRGVGAAGPTGDATCEVGRALEGRRCHIRLGRPDWPIPSTVRGDYDGASFVFRPPTPAGRGELVCIGLEDPVTVHWNAAGECRLDGELPLPADAPLFGRVEGAADLPEGTVFLQGCGAAKDDPVDADGSFFVLTSPGRCSMRAWRRSGKLKLQGPWVEAVAVSGQEVELELSVPTFEPAGLGVRVRPGAEGIEVTRVFDGTPAADAGLERGDVITTIDGAPVDGLGRDEFLELGLGPEGTTVELEGFDADGEPFDAVVRRAIIPQDDE
jgi:hypothetical protein